MQSLLVWTVSSFFSASHVINFCPIARSFLRASFPREGFGSIPGFVHSFIHSVFCLTTGPKTPPKRYLQIVWFRASSFKGEYPLLSLRSSSSFLRLLPRLLVTSISPSIIPSITCFRRQFIRKLWPIQLAFRFLISCKHTTLLKKWTTAKLTWHFPNHIVEAVFSLHTVPNHVLCLLSVDKCSLNHSNAQRIKQLPLRLLKQWLVGWGMSMHLTVCDGYARM